MKVFGPYRLDRANHCLWLEDRRAPLTPKAFDVLRYLVEHAGRLVSQDELLEALWPETYVNPEGIRKYILEIRKVLGDRSAQPSFIETIPKRGYQFIAPVSAARTGAAAVAAPEAGGKMVGRHEGLARLDEHLQAALSGQRQLVFVTGEAGIGKTTLVDAFQQHAVRSPGLRIARGQCIEGFAGLEAYYPMLEAIGSLIRGQENSPLVQVLAQRAPTWLVQFPGLVKPEQRESLQREILGSTRERMVRELCEALECIADQAPLLVILADLHWADPSTLDLISAFARRRGPAKLLLVGDYRPVDVLLSQSPLKALKQDLLVRRLCHEISLEGLEEDDVAAYLTKAFSAGSLPSGLAALVHRSSGGNPLFMAAIVEDMEKKGLLALDRDRLILTTPIEQACPSIPETLQQMLETQLERLSPEDLRILQSGSVAGERFPVCAVVAMLDQPHASIETACDRLANREQFIRSVGIHSAADGAPSAHYEFRHALYRQALYRSLSRLDRSQLHRSLGEKLMSICNSGRPELASILALHFEEGRDYEGAVRSLMLAAENAARRFSHRDSIQILRRALEFARSLASGYAIELEIQILLSIGDTQFVLHEMSDSVQSYESAVNLAARAGLKTAHAEALVRLASPMWYLDPTRGSDVNRQALDLCSSLDDPLRVAQMRLTLCGLRLLFDEWRQEEAEACGKAVETIGDLTGSPIVHHVLYMHVQAFQGDYQRALSDADALIHTTANPAVYAMACSAKGIVLLFQGRFGEMLQILRKGRESAERNGEDSWMYIFGEAWLRMVCFDFEGAQHLNRIVMRSDAEQHTARLMAVSRMSRGYAALRSGDLDEALLCFSQARDPRITPKFFIHWHFKLDAWLGIIDVWLKAGDLAHARREADGLLSSALSGADPNMQALAWEVQSRVASAEQDFDGARACMNHALAILDRFDIPVAGWQVHRTAWDLFTGLGDQETAGRHRARAKDLIGRIADSFDPGEPLRQSFLSAPLVRRLFEQGVPA